MGLSYMPALSCSAALWQRQPCHAPDVGNVSPV